jgi:hypothetical protein
MEQVKIISAASSPRLLCLDMREVPSRADRAAYKEYADSQPETLKLRLEVGANLVDADVWLAMLDHPHVKALVERGVFREDKLPRASEDFVPSRHVADLSALKPSEALKAIEACKDERVLRAWIDQDPRPQIRKALVARHRVIVPPEVTEKDDSVTAV